MINYTKYVLREIPMKEKGRVGGEPSDYDSSQNQGKEGGLGKKVSDCCSYKKVFAKWWRVLETKSPEIPVITSLH